MTDIEIERLEDAARRVFGCDETGDDMPAQNTADVTWMSATLSQLRISEFWRGRDASSAMTVFNA